MRLEDLSGHVQQFVDLTIPKSVKDDVALPARIDQVLHPQDGQLLRNGRALGRHGQLHLGNTLLPLAEKLEDSDSGRVRERLEKLGLEAL